VTTFLISKQFRKRFVGFVLICRYFVSCGVLGGGGIPGTLGLASLPLYCFPSSMVGAVAELGETVQGVEML